MYWGMTPPQWVFRRSLAASSCSTPQDRRIRQATCVAPAFGALASPSTCGNRKAGHRLARWERAARGAMLLHMNHDDLTIRLSTDQDGDYESIRRLASLDD